MVGLQICVHRTKDYEFCDTEVKVVKQLFLKVWINFFERRKIFDNEELVKYCLPIVFTKASYIIIYCDYI